MRFSRSMPSRTEAQVGKTTVAGGNAAVFTDGEYRGVRVFSPGGYVWRPAVGDDVLVLKTPDGTYALGAETVGAPEDMQPGDVFVRAASGASVYLKTDGTVLVSGDVSVRGRVDIEGSLYINGTEIV